MRIRNMITDEEFTPQELKAIHEENVRDGIEKRTFLEAFAAGLYATIRRENDCRLIGITEEAAERIAERIYKAHPDYRVYI